MSNNHKPQLSIEEAKRATEHARKTAVYFMGYSSESGTSRSLQWWKEKGVQIAYGFIGSDSTITFIETEHTAETQFTDNTAFEISQLGRTVKAEYELNNSSKKHTSAFTNLF